jgi:hypothetical protein
MFFVLFSVERLPDFADEKPEEKEEEEESKDDDVTDEAGDEPAGHDRQDSKPADENQSKPMTTEQAWKSY